jgi:2-polyprenyl-3-methyl-5-hydroxy-6-metoxy-1,4-benzoquinol methylase
MRVTSHSQQKEPFLEQVLENVRFNMVYPYINNDSMVADLGCGYHGNFLKKVSGKIKFGIGYDISINNKNLPKNIILKKADLNKGFNDKNNYYDSITVLAVLEHIKNPETFLINIKTMLNNGGKVIITTPHKKSKSILEFLSFKIGLISKDEIKDHKNYFDEKSLKILLKVTGFKIIKLCTFEFGWNLFCVAEKN